MRKSIISNSETRAFRDIRIGSVLERAAFHSRAQRQNRGLERVLCYNAKTQT